VGEVVEVPGSRPAIAASLARWGRGGAIHGARAAAAAAAWAVIAFTVFVVRPPCPIATLLGVPCPSCGMTRALLLLATGHTHASWRMHPLAAPAFLATALLAVSTLRAAWTTGNPSAVRGTGLGRVAVALAAIVYAASLGLWVARQLGALGGPASV
jgi:hypothetical protein